MIFDNIPYNDRQNTLQQALSSILSRKQSLRLSSAWSYVDLYPDEQDSRWLMSWAQNLKSATVEKIIHLDTTGDKGISVDGLSYDWQDALGLLILFAGADIGRREALAKEIWSPLRHCFQDGGVKKYLFQGNNATESLRDLIKKAATNEEFTLRHDFETQGGQSWLVTFWLQFGFSEPAFYGNMADGSETELPTWLSRQQQGTSLRSIDLLLNDERLYSRSFYQLWRAMAEFRRGERDDASLQKVLHSNSWVLPEWSSDLLRCLKRRRELIPELPQLPFTEIIANEAPISEPRLVWEGNSPEFKFEWNDYCCFGTTEEVLCLALKSDDMPRMPAPVILTRQANGLHTPISLNLLSVPASCQQITAEVFDATHTVVWSHDYLIWDALEDVNVFSLSTGKRISSPDHTHMNTGQGYIVFVADDLIISDSTLRRKALPDVDVIAYHLPPNWSKTLEVRLNEGHSCIWRPSTGNSRASLSVPANISSEIIECDFNTPIPISVRCEEGVTLESASCASMPLRRVPVAQNSYLLEGAKYTSETLHRRLPLRLVFHRNGIPETHDSFVNCKPRGMLMRKNGTVHSFNPTENIDVYIAQNNHFRVFVPDSDDWILWEGLTPHGRVVERWRELPHFDGLGAPFTARAGNESEKRLPLAGSVIDCGVIDRYKIGTQDNGKRYITIYLHHPIENTEGVELRWWDKHWSMQRWEPEHLPKEAQWTIPLLPACHGDPLAVAISQNGVRVGASWSKRWYLEKCLMQPSHIGEAARNMRWLRLPILQPAARPHMQEFVAKAGDILRSFWLGDESIDGWVYNVRDAESWKRAARTLMDSEE